MRYSLLQIFGLYQAAKALGHRWAEELDYADLFEGISDEEIEEICAERSSCSKLTGALRGIESPGRNRHTTTSGRLFYEVDAFGGIRVEVHRPACRELIVLEAQAGARLADPWKERAPGSGVMFISRTGEARLTIAHPRREEEVAYQRHLWALLQVLGHVNPALARDVRRLAASFVREEPQADPEIPDVSYGLSGEMALPPTPEFGGYEMETKPIQ